MNDFIMQRWRKAISGTLVSRKHKNPAIYVGDIKFHIESFAQQYFDRNNELVAIIDGLAKGQRNIESLVNYVDSLCALYEAGLEEKLQVQV